MKIINVAKVNFVKVNYVIKKSLLHKLYFTIYFNYVVKYKWIGGRTMKVSSAIIRLTSEDILGIAHEYIDVEGLKIKEVSFNEFVTVRGTYKKAVEIPFQCTLGFGNIIQNNINVILFDLKIAKVGILASVRKFAVKNLLKDFQKYGIAATDNNITIDLNTIVKMIPFMDLSLKAINIVDNAIEVEAEDIKYEPKKEVLKFQAKNDSKDETDFKISDRYSKLKENIEDKVPEKYRGIIEYAMLIPDIGALLWRLFKDKRVNIKTKMLVGGLLAYIASPLDIIPDFIPLVGKVDDIAIVLFAMNKIINEVPKEVILSNWTGKEDIIKLVSDGVAFISKMFGSQNVGKLLNYVKKLSILRKKDEEEQESSEKEG